MFIVRAELLMDLSEFKRMSARARDLTPAWRGPVDKLVTAFLVAQFASEGAEGGGRWAALSPQTIEARKRPGHGRGGIGRDTNRMWASLVQSPSPEGTVTVTPTTYSRGSSVPYETYFSKGRFGQPARPVFPVVLPPKWLDAIESAINRYIFDGTLNVESGSFVRIAGVSGGGA